jgi:hypothetical protein
VARELYERAMTFTDYVHHYGLARSEGLLLRYLSDAYKGLMQSVPEEAKTEEVFDLTEWLGETVRQVDSSLLDEWDRLRHPDDVVAVTEGTAVPVAAALADGGALGVTANARAFGVMVRNELFRWVELLSRHAYEELVAREGSGEWSADRLADAMAPYWDEHDAIGIDAAARSHDLLRLDRDASPWSATQTLADPAGHHDWAITARVRPDASDDQTRAVLDLLAITPTT